MAAGTKGAGKHVQRTSMLRDKVGHGGGHQARRERQREHAGRDGHHRDGRKQRRGDGGRSVRQRAGREQQAQARRQRVLQQRAVAAEEGLQGARMVTPV